MSKDDYFVIAYRILTYLYDCLKNGVPVDLRLLTPESAQVNEVYWRYIVKNLSGDGYITGVIIVSTLAGEEIVKVQPNIQITPKGIQYLHENSMFQKARELIKDLSGLIP